MKSKNEFFRQIEFKTLSLFTAKSPKLLENTKNGQLELSQDSLQQHNKKITYLFFYFLTANSFQNKRKETCHKTKGNARQRTTARNEPPVKLEVHQ